MPSGPASTLQEREPPQDVDLITSLLTQHFSVAAHCWGQTLCSAFWVLVIWPQTPISGLTSWYLPQTPVLQLFRMSHTDSGISVLPVVNVILCLKCFLFTSYLTHTYPSGAAHVLLGWVPLIQAPTASSCRKLTPLHCTCCFLLSLPIETRNNLSANTMLCFVFLSVFPHTQHDAWHRVVFHVSWMNEWMNDIFKESHVSSDVFTSMTVYKEKQRIIEDQIEKNLDLTFILEMRGKKHQRNEKLPKIT